MQPIRLEEDGVITVQVGEYSADLDLYQTHDRLAELVGSHRDKSSAEFFEAVLNLMEEVGLPRGSHRLASKFAKAVFGAVQELKKKDAPAGAEATPGSPASTGPAPSSSILQRS